MHQPVLRRYRPADRTALYRICLATGDAGGDASGSYADPELLGHVYLGAYLRLCPELAWVVDDGGGAPLGYGVGTADTVAFEAACERRWWPALRRRYPDPAAVPTARRSPDQRLAYLIHHPAPTAPELAGRYPAHLHLDLLPAAQGRGLGRLLMRRLLASLTAAGATGVHLGVDPRNRRAIGFYRRLGFHEAGPGTFVAALPAGAIGAVARPDR